MTICATCGGSGRIPWPEAGLMQACPGCSRKDPAAEPAAVEPEAKRGTLAELLMQKIKRPVPPPTPFAVRDWVEALQQEYNARQLVLLCAERAVQVGVRVRGLAGSRVGTVVAVYTNGWVDVQWDGWMHPELSRHYSKLLPEDFEP